MRILHLEDDPADAALIHHALSEDGIDFTIELVSTREAFLAAVSRGGFDLILSDFALPGFDGMSALKVVRERDAETPFIIVTGTIGEDRAAESIKIGGTDFVLKDRLARLGMAVRRAFVETRELAKRRSLEAQLRQSQKLEAVGRLTGSVAHDFNNLLAVIFSTTEMLLADMPREDPRRPDVSAIQEAANRGQGLTKQLLAFSRKQTLQPRVLDLNTVLRNLEPLLTRLGNKSVALDLRLEPALAQVKADPGQMEQVVVNLCVNARDAMPTGGRIIIQTANVSVGSGFDTRPVPPGAYVCLSVMDSGMGMDEETMSRIFEPFFTTKPEGLGTGLGLATVYGIIQQSGGHVWVTSQPGAGATFDIYLPPQNGPGAGATT